MFTVQELVTAAELNLPIPIIIWANGGLKQIQDDMKSRDIALVGVEGINPDFLALAHACGCHAEQAGDGTCSHAVPVQIGIIVHVGAGELEDMAFQIGIAHLLQSLAFLFVAWLAFVFEDRFDRAVVGVWFLRARFRDQL